MPSVNLSGTLLNPEGEPDEGAIVKFTLLSTTGSTISSSKSQLEVPQDGLYDIDIEYGNLRVDYVNEDGSTRFVAIVTVNGDTVATSLPELLNANVPPTDAQLLEFQTILAGAVAAQVAAEAAAASIPAPTTSPSDTTGSLRAQDAYAVNSINYHTGNTNFNVFGNNTAGDIISIGFAANSSIATFLLPLNSIVEPTSVTITSTFELRTIAGTLISGGHIPTISTRSHAKGAVIQISTSGLTTNQPLSLWSETATSRITVNF